MLIVLRECFKMVRPSAFTVIPEKLGSNRSIPPASGHKIYWEKEGSNESTKEFCLQVGSEMR